MDFEYYFRSQMSRDRERRRNILNANPGLSVTGPIFKLRLMDQLVEEGLMPTTTQTPTGIMGLQHNNAAPTYLEALPAQQPQAHGIASQAGMNTQSIAGASNPNTTQSIHPPHKLSTTILNSAVNNTNPPAVAPHASSGIPQMAIQPQHGRSSRGRSRPSGERTSRRCRRQSRTSSRHRSRSCSSSRHRSRSRSSSRHRHRHCTSSKHTKRCPDEDDEARERKLRLDKEYDEARERQRRIQEDDDKARRRRNKEEDETRRRKIEKDEDDLRAAQHTANLKSYIREIVADLRQEMRGHATDSKNAHKT